jgi:hypothetical protein
MDLGRAGAQGVSWDVPGLGRAVPAGTRRGLGQAVPAGTCRGLGRAMRVGTRRGSAVGGAGWDVLGLGWAVWAWSGGMADHVGGTGVVAGPLR